MSVVALELTVNQGQFAPAAVILSQLLLVVSFNESTSQVFGLEDRNAHTLNRTPALVEM